MWSGIMGADRFYKKFVVNRCGRFITESTHRGRRIVTLQQSFVKRFSN